MKFLAYANGEEAASRIHEMLEANGIPATIEHERLRVPFGAYGARFRFRVFVCLDSQFADAIELLKDPDHRVAEPVNAKEYHRWAESQPLSNHLVWGAPVLLLCSLAFLLLVLWLVGAIGGA